jgi:hypothetical protein
MIKVIIRKTFMIIICNQKINTDFFVKPGLSIQIRANSSKFKQILEKF